MSKHKCLICGKEVKKDKNGFVDGGIIERFQAGYGSRLDFCKFEIAICDKCLALKIKSDELKLIYDYNTDKKEEYRKYTKQLADSVLKRIEEEKS
jgi:hypothetical protein